jgi:hypothetical protein
MQHSQLVIVVLVVIVVLAQVPSTPSPAYRLTHHYSIPGEGSWDYISVDSGARRVYVSHSAQLQVLDADSGRLVGQIPDTPGVHGAAIAPELKRGFTSNGQDSSVTIFDTDTLKSLKKVSVNRPDFVLYEPFTKRVFPMNEKTTVLNAKTGDAVGEVDLGGAPEAGVSDENGTVYVNLVDKNAVAVVDPQSLKVRTVYSSCTSPHSLSYDAVNARLFVGCRDGLAVLDAKTGKVVGRSLMCSGVDGGAFDPVNKLIFESCSEGVISIIRQVSPDYYMLIDTVKTELWARTMTLDAKTKRIYLPTADFETIPTSDPQNPLQRRIKQGSFRVLVVEP